MRKHLHAGWLIERARFCLRERAFAEGWLRLNHEHRFGSFLQQLFSRTDHPSFLERKRPRLVVTARDCFVVATVVQWLGTNVGFGWLQDVLEQIGYDVVPVAESRRRYYYNPWEQPRDASAWQTLVANTVRGADQSRLKPKLVRPLPKRKHLLRYVPNGFGRKVCIRCGWSPVSGSRKTEPVCTPPALPVRVRRIKDLRRAI